VSQYLGKKQHGYWWLHANGTLQYSTNCHGMKPEEFFQNWTCIEWWHVRCELDWYRMMKEYKQLADGPVRPITA
jgi:hypothetical protein